MKPPAIRLQQCSGLLGRPIIMFTPTRRSRPTSVTAEIDAAADGDEELRQRVCRYLAHSGHAPVRSINVCASGGTVTLRGMAPTYYVRQLAISCAQRVAGVRNVVDEIEMEQPAGPKQGRGRCRSDL